MVAVTISEASVYELFGTTRYIRSGIQKYCFSGFRVQNMHDDALTLVQNLGGSLRKMVGQYLTIE